MKYLVSLYSLKYSRALIYLLQSSKYQFKPYFASVNKTKDFNKVLDGHKISKSRNTQYILIALRLGILAQLLAGLWLIYLGSKGSLAGGVAFGLALIVSYPILWAYLLGIILVLSQSSSVENAK